MLDPILHGYNVNGQLPPYEVSEQVVWLLNEANLYDPYTIEAEVRLTFFYNEHGLQGIVELAREDKECLSRTKLLTEAINALETSLSLEQE